MPSTTPTIGRRVYYWPEPGFPCNRLDDNQPYDAGIVYVYPDGRVNLLVTDHMGQTMPVMRAPFGEARDGPDAGFADWMPFQKGASHTEAPQS